MGDGWVDRQADSQPAGSVGQALSDTAAWCHPSGTLNLQQKGQSGSTASSRSQRGQT